MTGDERALITALDQGERRLVIHPSTRAKHHEQVAKAMKLLAKGASPNVTGPKGESLLHYGVLRDSLELVEFALSKGITPRTTGRTAIAYVEAKSAPGLFEALMAAGADPDARGAYGASLLWHLASEPDAEALPKIEALLAAGASVSLTPDDPTKPHLHGMTPLHAALWVTQESSTELEALVKMLLAAGADPKAPDASGTTPAQYAQRNGLRAVARLLGASRKPETLASLGLKMTSEHFLQSLRAERDEVIELFVAGGYVATHDDLWEVVLTGRGPLLKKLLANGATVDESLVKHAVTCREMGLAKTLRAAMKSQPRE